MPRFKVIVEEIVQYEVTVEAKDAAEAEDAAIETIMQAPDPNEYFVAVTEREAYKVEQIDMPRFLAAYNVL